jgi:GntR family transcriptional regulator
VPESTAMDLPNGVPVIAITRQALTSSGRCVEVNVMLLDASAYALEYAFGTE